MVGQLESYMVGEPIPMANIHSVLLVISVFWCVPVFLGTGEIPITKIQNFLLLSKLGSFSKNTDR